MRCLLLLRIFIRLHALLQTTMGVQTSLANFRGRVKFTRAVDATLINAVAERGDADIVKFVREQAPTSDKNNNHTTMVKKCTPYFLIPRHQHQHHLHLSQQPVTINHHETTELIQTLLSEEANLDEVLIEISSTRPPVHTHLPECCAGLHRQEDKQRWKIVFLASPMLLLQRTAHAFELKRDFVLRGPNESGMTCICLLQGSKREQRCGIEDACVSKTLANTRVQVENARSCCLWWSVVARCGCNLQVALAVVKCCLYT
jgi:hypothetical protein